MNRFSQAIHKNTIKTPTDLKRLYRRLARALHPDAGKNPEAHEAFIDLRRDYEEALEELRSYTAAPPAGIRPESPLQPDRSRCLALFADLLAANFPLDQRISGMASYLARIHTMNLELSAFGGTFVNLFLRVEEELVTLRGDSVIDNEDFGLLRLYLYHWSNSYLGGGPLSTGYVKTRRGELLRLLRGKGLEATATFVDWLATEP